METYNKKSVFSELKEFDHLAKEHDYIEITEWHNGEGFDIDINSYSDKKISLTWGEFKALKKLVKKLEE